MAVHDPWYCVLHREGLQQSGAPAGQHRGVVHRVSVCGAVHCTVVVVSVEEKEAVL